MATLTQIPSILSTDKYRHLALEALQAAATSGSSSSTPDYVSLTGGTVTVNNTAAQFSKINISTQTLTRPTGALTYNANAIVAPGGTVNCGSFVTGTTYFIASLGTGSTFPGASSSTVGRIFTATGAGTGTGTAIPLTTFTSVLPVNAGDGYIVAVRASTNSNSFSTALRLHLYKTIPTLLVTDNGQFTILNADFTFRIGYVDLSGWTTGGTGSDSSVCFGSFPGAGVTLPLELGSGSTSIFGIVEARAGFSANTGQIFNISLKTQLA